MLLSQSVSAGGSAEPTKPPVASTPLLSATGTKPVELAVSPVHPQLALSQQEVVSPSGPATSQPEVITLSAPATSQAKLEVWVVSGPAKPEPEANAAAKPTRPSKPQIAHPAKPLPPWTQCPAKPRPA